MSVCNTSSCVAKAPGYKVLDQFGKFQASLVVVHLESLKIAWQKKKKRHLRRKEGRNGGAEGRGKEEKRVLLNKLCTL